MDAQANPKGTSKTDLSGRGPVRTCPTNRPTWRPKCSRAHWMCSRCRPCGVPEQSPSSGDALSIRLAEAATVPADGGSSSDRNCIWVAISICRISLDGGARRCPNGPVPRTAPSRPAGPSGWSRPRPVGSTKTKGGRSPSERAPRIPGPWIRTRRRRERSTSRTAARCFRPRSRIVRRLRAGMAAGIGVRRP